MLKANPWLTYCDSLHKMREFGAAIKEMDLIDETKLSSEQMRVMLVTLLFDGIKKNLPHPDENWKLFISAVVNKMKMESKPFCVTTRKYKNWIDIKVLEEFYHGKETWQGGQTTSATCCMS